MRLSAVIQARTLAFIELSDLDPRGRTFFPETIKQIQERYGFLQVPKIAEIEENFGNKGVELKTGKFENKVIDSLKIFQTLFVVETHSNTLHSKEILEDLFEWGKQKLGLAYEPGMIRHWAYVSILTFYSDTKLPALGSGPLANLAVKTTRAVSEIWGEEITYEPSGIIVSHDPLARKNNVLSFTIQPRAETPYRENKYFSEAPLPTDVHIKFLEEFEAEILGQRRTDDKSPDKRSLRSIRLE